MTDAQQAKRFIVRIETLTSRGPTPDYTGSMFSLWDHSRLPEYQHIWLIPPRVQVCSDIPLGRNRCIQKDLQINWDAWLWIDDDHRFDPQVVWSLVEAMQRGCVDIVAPLMGTKSSENPGRPQIFRSYDKAAGLWNIMYTGWEQPDLYEVAAVGTGFQLVARRVFEQMPEPWYDRRISPARRDQLQGNDLNFSLKAKEMGFRIWLDSRVEIGHVASVPIYVRKDFLESGLQEQQLVDIKSSKPIEPYTGEDANSPTMWEDYWGKADWAWRERRDDIAKRLSYRIPEGGSVLYFGCGDGWLAKRIEELCPGSKVFGLDHAVGAISLTRRRGVDCKLISSMSGFEADPKENQKYDCILVTDWMERLTDPEKTIRELVKAYAKPSTIMVFMYTAMTMGPHHMKEYHHVWGEFTVGEFVSRFGRPMEIDTFKELIVDPNTGQVGAEIDRIISRSTLEKVTFPAVTLKVE
jgi:2-polyprenyl-3-methyl-5-hydroxy-6-metoxy-1,4-benzoquinol methylase